MFKKSKLILVLFLATSLLVACGSKGESAENKGVETSDKKIEGRWYTSGQSMRGKKVFEENCAVCHGAKGQGLVADWKKPDAAGKFPAPPLNGTAHTWHHSKDLLKRTVNEGGIALGGTMPPFKDNLTDQEKEAVLAHVMSLWPEDIYKVWQKRNPATK